jgi:hypothetical protein
MNSSFREVINENNSQNFPETFASTNLTENQLIETQSNIIFSNEVLELIKKLNGKFINKEARVYNIPGKEQKNIKKFIQIFIDVDFQQAKFESNKYELEEVYFTGEYFIKNYEDYKWLKENEDFIIFGDGDAMIVSKQEEIQDEKDFNIYIIYDENKVKGPIKLSEFLQTLQIKNISIENGENQTKIIMEKEINLTDKIQKEILIENDALQGSFLQKLPKLKEGEYLNYYCINEVKNFDEKEFFTSFSNTIEIIKKDLQVSSIQEVENLCEVKETNNQTGKGLYAICNLSRGSYITYYGILKENTSKITNQICLKFGEQYLISTPDIYKSKAYFSNHSCEPNAQFEEVIINEKPRMIIILNKEVQKNEEITFDYRWNSNNGKQLNLCKCSSSNCLFFIEEDKRKLFDKTLRKFKKSPKQIVKIIINL